MYYVKEIINLLGQKECWFKDKKNKLQYFILGTEVIFSYKSDGNILSINSNIEFEEDASANNIRQYIFDNNNLDIIVDYANLNSMAICDFFKNRDNKGNKIKQ